MHYFLLAFMIPYNTSTEYHYSLSDCNTMSKLIFISLFTDRNVLLFFCLSLYSFNKIHPFPKQNILLPIWILYLLAITCETIMSKMIVKSFPLLTIMYYDALVWPCTQAISLLYIIYYKKQDLSIRVMFINFIKSNAR